MVGKLLKKYTASRLQNNFKPYVAEIQHGFTSGQSMTTQLINFYHMIMNNPDGNLQTDGINLNLQKTFDSVNHKFLLDKLDKYAIKNPTPYLA